MSKELGNTWHFCEDNDGFNYGPGATPQRSFRKASSAASIVRESLQNSIDAAVNYPVRVVYKKKELNINDYPSLFGIDKCSDGHELEEHFQGMSDSILENDVQNKEEYTRKLEYVKNLKEKAILGGKVPCLCVSDYNTTGMEYVQEKNNGTFASFVRSLGKNDKRSKSSAGSNGVGKGAYIRLSQYNTLLVSSRFGEQDNQVLFEGNMLMVSHHVGDQAYHPYAFYDCNNKKPVSDPKAIPDDFIREEVGTDINIIGINDSNWDEQVKDMIEAVLKNFWLAIHAKRLVVVIEGKAINKTTLPDMLKEYFEGKRDGGQERTYNPLPYYNIVASETSDKIIHRKDTLPLLGEVEFYLNKAKTGNGRILYMRESRMLIFSKVEQMYNQINGVFVCTGEKGNEILKEAENEAHNEWKAKVGDEKAKEAIAEIEKYIQKCLEEAIGFITDGTVDIKSLAKRLPISTEPNFDEDFDEETDLDAEGSAVTETLETTDADSIKPHKGNKEKVGKVHVRKKKPVTLNSDGNNYIESLEGDGPDVPSTHEPANPLIGPEPNPLPFPGPNPGPVPLDNASTSITTTETLVGGKKKAISISTFETYAFAKKVGDEYVYDVRIKSAKEHEKANLVVTVGGETSDERLEIKESSCGNPVGNEIKSVHLDKGVTKFTFTFKENEKVSVKISAYEYKD